MGLQDFKGIVWHFGISACWWEHQFQTHICLLITSYSQDTVILAYGSKGNQLLVPVKLTNEHVKSCLFNLYNKLRVEMTGCGFSRGYLAGRFLSHSSNLWIPTCAIGHCQAVSWYFLCLCLCIDVLISLLARRQMNIFFLNVKLFL